MQICKNIPVIQMEGAFKTKTKIQIKSKYLVDAACESCDWESRAQGKTSDPARLALFVSLCNGFPFHV